LLIRVEKIQKLGQHAESGYGLVRI